MLEHVIERLNHTDPTVRYEAAQQLGKSQDTRAVAPLIQALPDENSKVQYAAISGLIKLGDTQAAEPIIDTLFSELDSRVWQLMGLNIGLRLRNGLLDMLERGNDQLIERLNTALAHKPLTEQQRAFTVRMLGRTADADQLAMLTEILLDGSTTMQIAAIEALGHIGDSRATATLQLFCTDDSDEVREVVIEALGRIGDATAYDPLIAALDDGSEWVRRAAATGLGDLGDRRAIQPLAELLKDESEMVQDATFDALKKLSYDSFTTDNLDFGDLPS